MSNRPNLQVLDYLLDKGIRFYIETWNEREHTTTHFVGREEIEEYIDDPDAFFAKRLGVTKELYRDWIEAHCAVRCSARTRRGKQCLNFVRNGVAVSPQEWQELQGEYCPIHSEGTASVRELTVRVT